MFCLPDFTTRYEPPFICLSAVYRWFDSGKNNAEPLPCQNCQNGKEPVLSKNFGAAMRKSTYSTMIILIYHQWEVQYHSAHSWSSPISISPLFLPAILSPLHPIWKWIPENVKWNNPLHFQASFTRFFSQVFYFRRLKSHGWFKSGICWIFTKFSPKTERKISGTAIFCHWTCSKQTLSLTPRLYASVPWTTSCVLGVRNRTSLPWLLVHLDMKMLQI